MISLEDYYKSLNQIGKGAYAMVFSGLLENDQKVAIKIIELTGEEKHDCDSHESYNNELVAIQTLQHPRVVAFHSAEVFSNALLLQLDFVETDLHRVIQNYQTPFSDELSDDLFMQILEGVSFIHEKGFVHRDLKPANILVTSDMKIKIADFGLAVQVPQEGIKHERQVVTRWYRAPELMLGFEFYNQTIDIWSLGCIYAEMKFRTVLWPGRNQTEQLFLIFQTFGTPKDWPEFDEIRERLLIPFCTPQPLELDAFEPKVFLGLLQYDPKKRITAKEALDTFQNRKPV